MKVYEDLRKNSTLQYYFWQECWKKHWNANKSHIQWGFKENLWDCNSWTINNYLN